jgi:RNA polymerase sigma factor for flagellar operon FliA
MDELRQRAPMVRRIAMHLARSLPANVELDDLVQVGMIALHESLGRFVDDGRASFETYASMRVRGAMIDELRRADPLDRRHRQEDRANGIASRVVSIDDLGAEDVDVLERLPADDSFDPARRLQDRRKLEALVAAVGKLPERDQNIMRMHYEHDATLREIGVVMGMSESRVCQVLSDIARLLRLRLRDH